ncbi:hypothetical protein CRX42_15050 [Pseudomonas jessenii]|uniref:Uncharacterized protein n=1 Tax=Pseudomonas jessenii TaxID=77298 RepID=A0A2W0EV02_PSEJE|nr:hypothetical protein CRX42_15050 [Pseudomonas jessenii]
MTIPTRTLIGFSSKFWGENRLSVGASLLAMDVNDDAGNLAPRVILESIASRLAPTIKSSDAV